ncbi:HSP20 family protein [Arenibacter nanhaiticus]|uniref:HSP20 family protein n=1 Tax=Arenibacter nanhaiticus TaxID=558155 RepID=A0A1M6BEY2_9FLAO|nr:Hsp20 family protein [Arenibacter nanhaiticus]SHI47310.1 HSP20 family protein [Arenibacter nanhaiticus]
MSLVKRNNVLFPAFVNEILKPDWLGGIETENRYLPAVNVKETEGAFGLELLVPGRKKEDFKIEIDNELLTVSSEIAKESNENEEKYTRREFSFSSFKRVFTLPESVDAAKIKVTYEEGILKFVLPKKEEAKPKPKRLIEIA